MVISKLLWVRKKNKYLLLCVVLLLQSCANYQLQYNKNNNNSITATVNDSLITEHTFYLIGDAGTAGDSATNVNLTHLKNQLQKENSNATVLFLGDNIYPSGMPKTSDTKRKEAEKIVDNQISATKNFKGRTIFTPGNHDWYNNGNEGLKREQEYIEKNASKKSFLPKEGCPIETVTISENTILIIVDSQWYITNWDNHPTINENCEIKTRNQFIEKFKSEIKKASGKTTLVAIHHPLFTNGPHGGYYSFKSHFTPFPVIGTLKNMLRKTTGISNADIQNTHYNELIKSITAAAQYNDKVIFVSGHEHSLQYIIKNNIPQIVSGSGSKTQPVKNTNGGVFAHSVNGYAVLKIYENGQSIVQFVNAQKDTVEFETTVFPANQPITYNNYPKTFPETTKASIYRTEETTKNKAYKFLWGNRYRDLYSTQITAKTATLDTLMGGLTPLRKGGGTQSRTLRLQSKDGKQYVMRAMKKNAAQYIQASLFKNLYIQKELENTASAALVQDVFTGAYPYAPFIVGELADEIDLYRLNSKLYYIPKHPTLGQFNSEFGDELYLFEEHPADDNLTIDDKNYTGKVYSTLEVLQKIQEDNDQMIDEKSYIRARLFDMLIGDWDRHQDQWRWLEFKEDDKTVFKPLARDRDQAFSIMSDGWILNAAVKLIPMAKILKKFNADLVDVKGFNLEPFSLDKAFLRNCNEEQWQQEAAFIQNELSSQVIDHAFKNIPKELNDNTILKIKETLLQRKNNLQKIAHRYCKHLSKYAVITGTNKEDFFTINATKDKVEITVFRKKKSNVQETYFSAIYDAKNTKELWLYGLDKDDTFEMTGKSNSITIRLIGGQNNDTYLIPEGKNVIIHDYKSKKNNLEAASKATIKLSDDYDSNTYDYKKIKTSQNQIIPTIGANPDDGVKIGINDTFTTYGFVRNPFTTQHQLKAGYYFATDGYELHYRFEWANCINNLNLEINAGIQSPKFTFNFFGFGNETENNDDELGLNYNRVRVRSTFVNPQLKWSNPSGAMLSAGLSYENVEVNNTDGRFVKTTQQLPSYIFDEVEFLSSNITFKFENFDNKAYPTMGMKTEIQLGHKINLSDTKKQFTYLIPEISFNHKIDPVGKWVVATKIKSHLNFSEDFEFYQAASIGGNDGVRGFRNQRFTGKNALYQNSDIRFAFNAIKTQIFPIRIGLFSSFDYGRVWIKNEDSKQWHNSFGGGLFVNGAELLSANLGAFHSADGLRVAFAVGFQF